jgi:hypothetical protein
MKDFNYVTFNEKEKYLFLSFLRVLGVEYHVSGYYDGYYIGFKCEKNQEKEIDNFLRLFEDRYTFTRELISEGAILRDHVDIAYTYSCKLHEMITDIADSLYNVGLSMKDRFLPEYKAIYNFFGADFFAGVLDDMSALNKQVVDPYKVNELLGSYLDRLS